MFVVYLTVFNGKDLPPFYIGSTSLFKHENGYRGSPSSKDYKSLWKLKLKYYPNLFKTFKIKSFKTREEAYNYEKYLHKKLCVISNPLYINKAIASRSFFEYNKHSQQTKNKLSMQRKGVAKSTEHKLNIGKSNKGKTRSKAQRALQSIRMKNDIASGKRKHKSPGSFQGEKNGMYGKHHTDESKLQMSLKQKANKRQRGKIITIDGVEYKSMEEAQKTLFPECTYGTARNRVLTLLYLA